MNRLDTREQGGISYKEYIFTSGLVNVAIDEIVNGIPFQR